jgi:hypothetical protein
MLRNELNIGIPEEKATRRKFMKDSLEENCILKLVDLLQNQIGGDTLLPCHYFKKNKKTVAFGFAESIFLTVVFMPKESPA